MPGALGAATLLPGLCHLGCIDRDLFIYRKGEALVRAVAIRPQAIVAWTVEYSKALAN